MYINYVIVFVGNMQRSVAFYRDTIGLPLRFESSHWTEFETGAATLALHIAEDETGAPSGTSGEAAGRCRPGLSVADLDAFHARMLAAGVPCIHPPRSVFGARLAQYADPDGLAMSVAEARPPDR